MTDNDGVWFCPKCSNEPPYGGGERRSAGIGQYVAETADPPEYEIPHPVTGDEKTIEIAPTDDNHLRSYVVNVRVVVKGHNPANAERKVREIAAPMIANGISSGKIDYAGMGDVYLAD